MAWIPNVGQRLAGAATQEQQKQQQQQAQDVAKRPPLKAKPEPQQA
jgi:hypothetical protein